MFLLTISVLLAVERYFTYQVKAIHVLYKKIKCYFRKKQDLNILDRILEKNDILFTHSSLLMVEKMVGIGGGSS